MFNHTGLVIFSLQIILYHVFVWSMTFQKSYWEVLRVKKRLVQELLEHSDTRQWVACIEWFVAFWNLLNYFLINMLCFISRIHCLLHFFFVKWSLLCCLHLLHLSDLSSMKNYSDSFRISCSLLYEISHGIATWFTCRNLFSWVTVVLLT